MCLDLIERSGASCSYCWVEKKSEDWIESYKHSIAPVECGSFWVRPTWHESKSDLIDVVIDPNLVFGTGHHETTCGVLKQLSQMDLNGKSLLDVGAGSGILAIAAAKMGATVALCDTDEVAVAQARDNAKLNSVVIRSSWVGSAGSDVELYDVVVANIVTDVLVAIKGDLVARLKSGGKLILSGILEIYEKKIQIAYGDLKLLEVAKKGEWLVFLYQKI